MDTLAASATHSRIWAAAVVGMFGPTGTYRHILSGLAPPDEGLVVSRAMDDYAAKGGPFDAKYFRGFVENAVKERKRELGTGNGNGNGRGPSGEGRAETPDRGDNDWSHLD